MRQILAFACLASLLLTVAARAQDVAPTLLPRQGKGARGERIRPYVQNPRFWQYKGQPVMLLGANKTDSPYLLPDPRAYFDALARLGGNYTRYVVKQRLDEPLVQIFPYKKILDGKYDLNQWDEEYWNRFEQGLKLTRDRDIILQLELWDVID